MKTFLRRIVKFFIGLVVFLIVLLVALIFFLGSLVEKGINTAAPALLGVSTHVDSVAIRPVRGIVQIKNLTLANPQGYTTDKKLFEITEFYVNVNMASLLSDTIKIRKILIQGPSCTYEIKEGTSNIDALIAKLNKGTPSDAPAKDQPAPAEQPQDEKAGKKVMIDECSINDTRLAYASPLTAGKFVTLPVASITLKDIGKKNNGASFSEALTEVMNALLKGITSALSNTGDLLGTATKSVTQAEQAAAETLDSGVKETTKVLDSSVKGATETLDSGVKGTTKAVGSALDEVGGLFKSKKKE